MCRLVYELTQTQSRDTTRFRSIDRSYFVPARPDYGRVTRDHNARRQTEIDVKKGDICRFFENHWDGYAEVQILNTTKKGLIPAFKIDRTIKTYNYSSNTKT